MGCGPVGGDGGMGSHCPSQLGIKSSFCCSDDYLSLSQPQVSQTWLGSPVSAPASSPVPLGFIAVG